MSLNRDHHGRKKSIDEIMEEMENQLKLETLSNELKVNEEIDARMFGFARRPSRSPIPSPRQKPGNLIPSRATDERYYDTSHSEIGKALIFNQRDFHDKSTRKGTNKDASDLELVFRDLGFDVAVFRDLSHQDIMTVLEHGEYLMINNSISSLTKIYFVQQFQKKII
jgi:hypothetical protein